MLTKERFDAVLFDLDGVVTDTAKIHAVSWKRMFDNFLKHRTASGKEPFDPFDAGRDYKLYVDGRLRYDGVRNFLESRSVHLPYGDPEAPPDYETITGLGNMKDAMVKELIATEGIEVYQSSVDLVQKLRKQGIKIAVVSASKNCKAVLEAGRIDGLFDVRVDGEVADRMNLPGKPAADTFLEAAKQLGVSPDRSVVVEDAISGVQAGRAGNFGLVIGVDRKGDADSLRANGADVVVKDLEELL